MDFFSNSAATLGGFQTLARPSSHERSPSIAGASQHSAVFPTFQTTFNNDLLSFLSYIKTRHIPIFSVAMSDIRSVLGRGASFFVNGAEMPETAIDEITGNDFPKGSLVAMKRAVLPPGCKTISEGLSRRIHLLLKEVLTMKHPPLAAHPNIVQLLGIGFEVEGYEGDFNVIPFLVTECAELGNLAEVLETAKRQGRPFDFDQKISFCKDVAHGLEALHACDIVHGDIKCENVLVFENPSENDKGKLACKLIDFGFSHLDASSHSVAMGASPPWQAPELISTRYLRIESAKRTDIYSFGLLLWRLMLDGDPFDPLETFPGETEKEKREARNQHLATLKEQNRLIEHINQTLESSGILDEVQLTVVNRVIEATLSKDPASRELDLSRIIRLLSPDFWYNSRQYVMPERVALPQGIELFDIEKYYHEFRRVEGVVKEKIAKSFLDLFQDSRRDRSQIAGAAHQLAVCYTLGFGVNFEPQQSVRWLEIAAVNGSERAKIALPQFRTTFDDDLGSYEVLPSDLNSLSLQKSRSPDLEAVREKVEDIDVEIRGDDFYVSGKPADRNELLIESARMRHYNNIRLLLENGTSGKASTEDGVTALHYSSSWDIAQAHDIGRQLVTAGADINASADKGASIGGTPLMWSVYENRPEHSLILLELGASTTAVDVLGVNALSLCAKLHLNAHLKLLLSHTKPIDVEPWAFRLIQEAASGESRFSRIVRHGKEWHTAPVATLLTIRAWLATFHDGRFNDMLLAAIKESMTLGFGASNSDIQIQYLDACGITPNQCPPLLAEAILTDNRPLFDHFISREIPLKEQFDDGKTLLHLCAQNPNNTTANQYFAEKLIKSGDVDVNAHDGMGYTPFMDALLARKWDLAWHLIHRAGADPLATNNDGYSVLGLIIRTLNLGAAKWALKYSGKGDLFRAKGFLVHPVKRISAIQEAARLQLPRAHGMKTEVSGLFLYIVTNFMDRERIDFRSDGILPNASALDIAAFHGNVHAVKALVKKNAHLHSGTTALALIKQELGRIGDDQSSALERMNLERCRFIIENWEKDPKRTESQADKWTKLRTIDESNIKSSWEVVAWEWLAGS